MSNRALAEAIMHQSCNHSCLQQHAVLHNAAVFAELRCACSTCSYLAPARQPSARLFSNPPLVV
jgi:hypothetical protein